MAARSRTCATTAIPPRRSRRGCGKTHARARSGAGDLVHLGGAVDGIQAPRRAHRRATTSRSFLMVLPKEMRSRRCAGCEQHLDLGDRGGVEARPERGEDARAPRAPGWPSRHRTPSYPAAPWRRPDSFRARRRESTTRQGPSSARLRQELADARGH